VAPHTQQQQPTIEIRRSRRRRRTVSAYRDGDTIVVLLPALMSPADEQKWVKTMVARVGRAEKRRRPDDAALHERARLLSRRYLDDRADPASVRWVSNQNSRWGSCTPADRTIRLTDRLQGMPGYVVDYVLVHELAHLLVPGHNDDFWRWVNRYELTERARGFLEATSVLARRGPSTAHDDHDEVGDDLNFQAADASADAALSVWPAKGDSP
jgi:predicted metal-dependent hydrolase